MTVVQLFRREQRNREAFSVVNRAHADANMRAIFYYAVFYPAIDLLAALAMALILIRGGGLVLGGGLTIGVLVAFIQYSERFWRPISDLSEKFNVLQAAMAASERIFGLLDTTALVLSPAEPRRPASVEGRVRFENVWFSYAAAAAAQHGDRHWLRAKLDSLRLRSRGVWGVRRSTPQNRMPRNGSCGRSTSRSSRAAALPWWVRPARARPRSSAC